MEAEVPGREEQQVYVVDDDPAVRLVLWRLLSMQQYRVATHSSALDLLSQPPDSLFGCLLLDLGLPDLPGLDALKAFHDEQPSLVVLIVTGSGDVLSCVEAMKAGALDVLVKPVARKTLIAAVAAALQQARETRVRRQRHERLSERFATLTPREAEVLQHVVRGRLNKQIASELRIVERTVKIHRSRAMAKLGAESLAELVHVVGEFTRPIAS